MTYSLLRINHFKHDQVNDSDQKPVNSRRGNNIPFSGFVSHNIMRISKDGSDSFGVWGIKS